EDRPKHFDPAEIGRAGVFVGIGHDGRLSVDRGYVRPDDEAPAGGDTGVGGDDGQTPGSDGQRTVISVGGEPEPQDDEDDVVKPLPEWRVIELNSHRSLALRYTQANNPHIAISALLRELVRDTFQHVSSPGCLDGSVRHVFFPVQADDLKDSASAKSVDDRQE